MEVRFSAGQEYGHKHNGMLSSAVCSMPHVIPVSKTKTAKGEFEEVYIESLRIPSVLAWIEFRPL